MPHHDKYANFAALAADPANVLGRDYSFAESNRGSELVVVAPHGGGIEPGTSELAAAIAGENHSLYVFEGLKAADNFADFHITSTAFDGPGCRQLLRAARSALGIHGEDRDNPVVFIGGRDEKLMARLADALRQKGFTVAKHTDPEMQGEHPDNVCNLGTSGAGAQLEISAGLRRQFFASLKRAGRQQPTRLFHTFTAAVHSCLP